MVKRRFQNRPKYRQWFFILYSFMVRILCRELKGFCAGRYSVKVRGRAKQRVQFACAVKCAADMENASFYSDCAFMPLAHKGDRLYFFEAYIII